MLHVFRGHTKKIFWGLVAFVVPAFCLWGLGSSYLERENNKELGRVQGVTITQRDFQRQLEAVRRAMEIDIAKAPAPPSTTATGCASIWTARTSTTLSGSASCSSRSAAVWDSSRGARGGLLARRTAHVPDRRDF
jgi:hypothetical protein